MACLTRLRQSPALAFATLVGLAALCYLYLTIYETCCGRDFRLIHYAILGLEGDWQPREPPVTDACYNDNLLEKLGISPSASSSPFYFAPSEPVNLARFSSALSPGCLGVLLAGSGSSEDPSAKSSACFQASLSLTPDELSLAYQQLGQVIANFTARRLEIFLADGSLIGSLRHFGIIPWDDDVDFLIRRDQKPHVRRLLEELTAISQAGSAPGYRFVDTEEVNQHWKLGILCHPAPHHHHRYPRQQPSLSAPHQPDPCRLYVDLFFTHRAGRWLVRDEWPNYYPLADVYPLAERPFGPGHLLPAPRRPLHLLQREYRSDVLRVCSYQQPHQSQSSSSAAGGGGGGFSDCPMPDTSCRAVSQLGGGVYAFVKYVRLRGNATLELLLRRGELLAAFLPAAAV